MCNIYNKFELFFLIIFLAQHTTLQCLILLRIFQRTRLYLFAARRFWYALMFGTSTVSCWTDAVQWYQTFFFINFQYKIKTHFCKPIQQSSATASTYSHNHPTNSSCVNWNQYYTNCTQLGGNPFQGTISFDNIGMAWVAIFLVSEIFIFVRAIQFVISYFFIREWDERC